MRLLSYLLLLSIKKVCGGLLAKALTADRWLLPAEVLLQYYLNKQRDLVYTLKKLDPMGQQTCSAHPARFSPDDKYSRHRITIKKRFKVLMTQQPRPVL